MTVRKRRLPAGAACRLTVLAARARRIVRTATGVSEDEAARALEAAGGSAKVAVVALLSGIDAAAARDRLERTGGHIRPALELEG